MRLAKSILSPIRATRDLSFLSRRLRPNGSLKGGEASPFGKKRGCAFENHEPSSPKVTCIGQVRVKSKKKAKQRRSLSRRRSIGEVSFRKIEQSQVDGDQQSEDKLCARRQRYSSSSSHYQQPQECLPHRNQRWVHLPISVREALRAFGADLSCMFPCRCSCFTTAERGKAEKKGCCENEIGCGAEFARWLVSVNDCGGGQREIELVVGGAEEEEETAGTSVRSSRRHVFDDIEVKDGRIEVKGEILEEEQEQEEEARVSICVPPKNALLLMRCRSDPTKMAALANRFSLPASNHENEDIEEEYFGHEETEDIEEPEEVAWLCEVKDKTLGVKEEDLDEGFELDDVVSVKPSGEQGILNEAEANLQMEVGDHDCIEELCKEELVIRSEETVGEKQQEAKVDKESLSKEEQEEVESNMSSFEALLGQENTEHYGDYPIEVNDAVEQNPICHLSAESNEGPTEGHLMPPLLQESALEQVNKEGTEESTISDKGTIFVDNDNPNQAAAQLQTEQGKTHQEGEKEKDVQKERNQENEEWAIKNEESKKEKESPALPECLLLMMCEPKLSMEVSKETWVRGTDFIRWLPAHKPAKATKTSCCHHEPVKGRPNPDSKTKPRLPAPPSKKSDQQPPRSSCSLPVASMANMIEHKLVNAGGAYEPFALTRCKSEPMRTAAAKLIPDSCSWKNASLKLEPHRPTTLGVGAAGIS